MDFAVLLAVYGKDNPEHYKTALESISVNQTLKPTQIVVVFDGPVPNTIEKTTYSLEKSNPQIEFTIVKLETNQGLAAALNAGLLKCKYEYVARMDADDVAVPDRFEKQLNYLYKNKDIDILGGTIAEFDNNPEIVNSIREVGCSHDEILKMAKHRTPFNHMTVVYKKSKVLSVGGYNTSFGKLEDYKLWIDLISGGCKTANLRDVLIHMRVGNGLIARRSNRREIQDWDKLQKDLISAGLINGFESFLNKIYIRVFTYMPSGIKKVIYKFVLRGKT